LDTSLIEGLCRLHRPAEGHDAGAAGNDDQVTFTDTAEVPMLVSNEHHVMLPEEVKDTASRIPIVAPP
jgi:hypothetical protein